MNRGGQWVIRRLGSCGEGGHELEQAWGRGRGEMGQDASVGALKCIMGTHEQGLKKASIDLDMRLQVHVNRQPCVPSSRSQGNDSFGGNRDPSHKFLRSSDFYLFEILLQPSLSVFLDMHCLQPNNSLSVFLSPLLKNPPGLFIASELHPESSIIYIRQHSIAAPKSLRFISPLIH